MEHDREYSRLTFEDRKKHLKYELLAVRTQNKMRQILILHNQARQSRCTECLTGTAAARQRSIVKRKSAMPWRFQNIRKKP